MYLAESKNPPEEEQMVEKDLRNHLNSNNIIFEKENKIMSTGLDPITGKSIKPLASFISDESYKRLEEKMLSVHLHNEASINGPASEWKNVLLTWIIQKFKQITWRVSIQVLKDELKKSGIRLNEDDSQVSLLIIQWLEAFRDTVKEDLKLQMNMMIIE